VTSALNRSKITFVISGNSLPTAGECEPGARERDDSRALRDIQNLIAKLEVVNRQLAVPPRTRREPLPAKPDSQDPDGADAADA
jgi:hypothetical protein